MNLRRRGDSLISDGVESAQQSMRSSFSHSRGVTVRVRSNTTLLGTGVLVPRSTSHRQQINKIIHASVDGGGEPSKFKVKYQKSEAQTIKAPQE